MPRLFLLMSMVGLCLLSHSAAAVYEKPDGFPWNLSLHGDHDKPIIDKLGSGFFMNVGPTGIRAQITHDHPAFFTVKFVFDKSPAAGKIKAGDIIIGANGHVMNVAHRFGRRNVTGWDGPMQEMAKLIEDSQGKEGDLELIVWPGGKRSEQKKVMLQIPAVGRFSKTFPYNCERSDKLMGDLCDFLANEYQRNGKFGRQHVHTSSLLALMASGDNKYSKLIESAMSRYPSKRYDSLNGNGYLCWGLGLDGVVIGEYYLLTKDQRLIPAAQSLARAAAESQSPVNGGYSHRPYPFISRRIADGGPAGYGPMSGTTGLIFLTHSLFKAGGLDYSEACYQRMHQGYLSSWTDKGYIDYGMKSWHHAVIEPTGESIGKATNKKGVGYEIPDGMAGIDTFKLIWPTETDKRGGPTDWLGSDKELERARVYLIGKNKYVVVRDMSVPSIDRMPPKPTRPIGHIFRSGTAALGHSIANADNKSWRFMSDHYAQALANSPNAILDGHASTLMHTLWGSLGAARADTQSFQSYMQGMKWWFIMAQTHDGSFVPMPGRDYASTDHVYAGRNFPTATAALILSVKEQKLMITGAKSPTPPSSSTDQTPGPTNTRPQAQPQATLLGDSFKPVHCAKEAKALNNGANYAQVLRMLDQAMATQDERGKEAIVFAQALRDWITLENKRLTQAAQTSPAGTLLRARDHARRLNGYDLPDATAFQALVKKLNDDRNTRTLARYYERIERIDSLEARRGASESTLRDRTQIVTMIEKFLEIEGLSDNLIKEAKALRDKQAKS